MAWTATADQARPTLGIALMAVAMLAIPLVDGIAKYLSAGYSPLFIAWAQYAAAFCPLRRPCGGDIFSRENDEHPACPAHGFPRHCDDAVDCHRSAGDRRQRLFRRTGCRGGPCCRHVEGRLPLNRTMKAAMRLTHLPRCRRRQHIRELALVAPICEDFAIADGARPVFDAGRRTNVRALTAAMSRTPS